MESQLRIEIEGGTYQEDRQTRIKEEHLVGSVDVRGDVLLLLLRWQRGEKQLVAKRDAAVLWEMAVLFTRGRRKTARLSLGERRRGGKGSPDASAELAWEVGYEGCYLCKGKQAWGCRWEKAGSLEGGDCGLGKQPREGVCEGEEERQRFRDADCMAWKLLAVLGGAWVADLRGCCDWCRTVRQG